MKNYALLLLVFLLGCNSTSTQLSSIKQNELDTLLTEKVNSEALDNHYQYLSSKLLDGRKYNTKGSFLAQDYLVDQLQQSDVKPFKGQFRHSFQHEKAIKTIQGTNIVGLLPSNNGSLHYIVLTAHYDHLGTSYLGADDNASGTAALLVIAKQLSKQTLNSNVVILFTDAEEAGLLGAKAFASENSDIMENAILNVNLDMLAGSQYSKKLHYISYGMNKILSKEDLHTLKHIKKQQPVPIYKGFKRASGVLNEKVTWKTASDHGVFYKRRIPFIYYGVGTHVNYHTRKDTYKNSNKILLKQSTNAIYQHLLYINKAINK